MVTVAVTVPLAEHLILVVPIVAQFAAGQLEKIFHWQDPEVGHLKLPLATVTL